MAELDQEAYQPRTGDISIREARRGRHKRFKVYVYRNQCWEQFGSKKISTFSEQDVQELTIPPWHFLGESEWKGKKRYYYRCAECHEEQIPQFPHGSGWNLEDYKQYPYFYEHITLQEAERLSRGMTERLYKVVCLQPYDHYHKNTYFVQGAFLARFLRRPTFTAILTETIVSIEPVESMPSTDEKLT